MRKGRIFRIFGVGFILLSLVAVSTYASSPTLEPPSPADVQSGSPAPEIRAGGASYNHHELQAITGQTPDANDDFLRSVMSPSAVEGQPRELDWTPVRRVAVRPGHPQTLYAAIDNLHGLWRSTTGGDFWEQMPFGDGSGRTIVFANSSVAVATFGYWDGAKYANGGIWRTSDGGSTWEDVGAGIDNMVIAVAFDPTNSARIYAGTLGAGIYRGDYSAGSVSWTQINSGLSDTTILSIAVSLTSPAVLYAGGYNWVYYSDDYGDNWVIADNNYPSLYTEAVAVSPTDPDTFYAGAQRLGGVWSGGLTPGGFYKSTAGAGDDNLVLKNVGMQETFVLDIAKDPDNPNILYAGTWGSGFFRSDDGGDTWVAKNAGIQQPFIYGIEAVADGGSPTGVTLYAATFYTGESVYVSTDRGETWTVPYSGALPSAFDITTTTSPDDLAAATGYGVLFSDDGGVTWYISHDLTEAESGIVLELARDPNNGSKLLAATYGGGIWTSTDAGANWTETSAGIGGGAYVYDLTYAPGSSTTAYAASFGVWRTTNGGSTWAALGSLGHWVRDVDALGGLHPDLFAGTNDAGVHMSPDADGMWTAINTGLGDYRVRSLKAVDANHLFAGTNGSSAWDYTVVSRPLDAAGVDEPEGTDTWTQQGPYIWAPGVIQIAIDPVTSSTIYAATDQGVYKSTNGGETWDPKNQGLGGYGDLVISGISIDPSNVNTIYLGTWGYGVFKSTNGGNTWTRLADPLKCSKVYLPNVMRNYAPPVISLVNGDFEQGPSVGWGQASDQGWALILHESQLAEGVTARSGEWAAWLGGDDDEFSVIWQDATIPIGDPTLRFYHWDASEDECGNDYGYVYINGGYPYAYWQLCSDKNTYGWVGKSVNLSAYAGQTVEIAIAASTNGSLNSNLFVDDVTLGSTSLADPSVQAEPLVLDGTAGKQGLLPNPMQAREPMPSRWLLPTQGQ